MRVTKSCTGNFEICPIFSDGETERTALTYFPGYLKEYPNMHTRFPLHLSLNRLTRGYPAHRHDFLEFSYVVEGSGAEMVNGVRHPMTPGTFTFILPYQVHELFADPGSTLVLYNCMFSMDLLMDQGGAGADDTLGGMLDDAVGLSPYVQMEGREHEALCGLLDDMFEEYRGDAWGRVALLKAKLAETLVRFDRYRRKNASALTAERVPVRRDRSVWRIIHYIHLHYQEDLMLSELAGRFSMSVSRISEVIKETTGQNFVQFLHDLRLRHASGLLVSTDMSMTEIAMEVGYGSYKTFARIFKERKGVVPSAYRHRQQGGER